MAGIYIHVPFCETRCIYCGFFSTTSLSRRDAYVDAVCSELSRRKDYLRGEDVETIYFGGGTYGVNAASKYYFGHGATDITPAEAAILVIQLSNPAFYNPFDHPNRAMDRQQDVLKSMVAASFITQDQATESFENYWADFDYTRTSTSAYMMRDDKAPWFSEYVRRELGSMIYGSDDIYTSGLDGIIYSYVFEYNINSFISSQLSSPFVPVE